MRWRLIKYLIAFLPLLTVFASPFSDPIKKQILNKYDIRWCRIEDATNRAETVAIRNGGNSTSATIRIQVTFPMASTIPISDFSSSGFNSGERTSFFDAVINQDSISKFAQADSEKMLRVGDQHSTNRTLYAIDKVFDDMLLTKLEESNTPKIIIDAILDKNWSHKSFIQNCSDRKLLESRCKVLDAILTRWEFSKHSLWLDARNRWREATGVTVDYSSDRFSSREPLYFDFALGEDQSGFLEITYGPEKIKPLVTLSSAGMNGITRVEPNDLHAQSWKILTKYYPVDTIIAVGLVVLSVAFAWPLLRPTNLLPVHKVFNMAIRTNDDEVWDIAFRKHRYFIIVELKNLISQGKNISISSEEVFDFLKYRMRQSFGKHSEKFKDNSELNEYIIRQLKMLVTRAIYADH